MTGEKGKAPAQGEIMVVDDTTANLKLLSDLLTGAGYQVRPAVSGELAWRSVQAKIPDLFLLDVMMPGMDGLELCRKLKSDERTRSIPVLFISALGDEHEKVKGFQAGGVDYITKPFFHEEVLARVDTHLRLRRAQFDLERRTAELTAANSDLRSFGQAISHDLRTPLTVVLTLSELLMDDLEAQSAPGSLECLDKIQKQVKRMASLIDALLGLFVVVSREMKPVRVDLSELVQSVEDEFMTKHPDWTGKVHIERGLMTIGDEPLLRDLVQNLLGNAWKFTGKAPTPKIEFGKGEHQGTTVFFIRDNGAGFPAERAKDLFTPFRRLHSNDEYPGLGIGLSTAQKIVQKHNGRIWAESVVGQGATFFFCLDAKLPEDL